jgi:tagaturonate reductase
MLNLLGHPILQFGTSRFLQAHVDLFVSEALARGEALGGITVVQTTDSAESSRRAAALATGAGYDVQIRGLRDGEPVDERVHCRGIRAALRTATQWPQVLAEFAEGHAQVVVSNTGDTGWLTHSEDGPELLAAGALAPRSFPAKLLVLLQARWQASRDAPLTLLPCELISCNGDRLQALVRELAGEWGTPGAFQDWLAAHPVWANSLVDRIVPAALEPAGAVAEPYALWAIAQRPGLVLPCRHPAIVLTDNLGRHERLKLWLLNLGHTVLAHAWMNAGQPEGMTVLEAMHDASLRGTLEAVWSDEVLPVFDALGEAAVALQYAESVRERFLNPWLAHRLADIAVNHPTKVMRRLAPVVAMARQNLSGLAQPALRRAIIEAGGPV